MRYVRNHVKVISSLLINIAKPDVSPGAVPVRACCAFTELFGGLSDDELRSVKGAVTASAESTPNSIQIKIGRHNSAYSLLNIVTTESSQ